MISENRHIGVSACLCLSQRSISVRDVAGIGKGKTLRADKISGDAREEW
ncbi:MAG: hypothetical protein JSS02_05750 [Planctomycetes bacterium]|nr:hypothetical protein [Planctomycetota bacterium]